MYSLMVAILIKGSTLCLLFVNLVYITIIGVQNLEKKVSPVYSATTSLKMVQYLLHSLSLHVCPCKLLLHCVGINIFHVY